MKERNKRSYAPVNEFFYESLVVFNTFFVYSPALLSFCSYKRTVYLLFQNNRRRLRYIHTCSFLFETTYMYIIYMDLQCLHTWKDS